MHFNTQNARKVVINADDFAQSEAIDQAIIHLASQHIIHSTSAMVLSPRWVKSAKSLVGLNIQVGLHLDLTSTFTQPYGYEDSLSALILKSYLKQLDVEKLSDFIEFQYDAFITGYGQPPDFIDGHQHVHQLPVVRNALFKVLTKKGWGQQAHQWLRICSPDKWQGLKAKVIQALGAEKARQMANQAGINTNSDFSGVYDFDPKAHLETLWQGWLQAATSPFSVIMCHVALPTMAGDASDPIYQARVNEYQWLTSEQFKRLRQQANSSL